MTTKYIVTFLDPSAPRLGKDVSEHRHIVEPLIGERPAADIMNAIFTTKRDIGDTPIFILKAQTGAGKSTSFIHWAYQWSRARNKSTLAAEPRIVLCQNLSATLDSIFSDLTEGDNLGYVTGESKIRPKFSPNLTYVTHQIVNFKLDQPDIFNKQTEVVVIDEVHEGSLQLAFLMRKINNYVKEHSSNAPIFVLASATLDEHMLSRYFNISLNSALSMLFIGGKPTYPIRDIFIKNGKIHIPSGIAKGNGVVFENEENILVFETNKRRQVLAADIATKLWESIPHREAGDILTFFTGADEFRLFLTSTGKNGIDYVEPKEANKAADEGTLLQNPTYVEASAKGIEDKEVALSLRRKYMAPGEQRHYLSTTLLESGDTPPNAAYVISPGFKNVSVANFLTFTNELVKMPVSKSSAIQRRGRVGRLFPGTVIHLYSEDTYDKLINEDFPATLLDISLSEFIRIAHMEDIRRLSNQRDKIVIDEYISPHSLPQLDTVNLNLPTPVSLEASIGIYRQMRRFMMVTSYSRVTPFALLIDRWDPEKMEHSTFLESFVKIVIEILSNEIVAEFLIATVFKSYIRNGVITAPDSSRMIMRSKQYITDFKLITDFIKDANTLAPISENILELMESDYIKLLYDYSLTGSVYDIDMSDIDIVAIIKRVCNVLRTLASGIGTAA